MKTNKTTKPEEILDKYRVETWNKAGVPTGEYKVFYPSALKAMQEYADLYHKEKLREELIAFAGWITNEYLKQINK